jgi:hypothetical protein
VPDELPFIDEFDVVVEAPAAQVFRAVASRLSRTFEGRKGRGFTFLLGCAQRGHSFSVPPVAGQETNGFRVAEVLEPTKLVLEGRHRFATYRLAFRIEPLDEKRATLRARTDALFPGLIGGIYRALVIGSGAHAMLARKMLSGIAKQAGPSSAGALTRG